MYDDLERVYQRAVSQAADGKGKVRHTRLGEQEDFSDQQIVEIGWRLRGGIAAGPLYQAVKKIYESVSLEPGKAQDELLGAMNYIAAAILILRRSTDATD